MVSDERIVSRLNARYLRHASRSRALSFAISLSSGREYRFGDDSPIFTLSALNEKGDGALASADLLSIGDAVVQGSLKIHGDLEAALRARRMFSDFHPLIWIGRYVPSALGQIRHDTRSIESHYDADAEFFELFLDRRFRCYTQGIFVQDHEPLEVAIERKLAYAFDAIAAPADGQVLEVGGGWGAFVEYAGSRGAAVTSLTLSRESEAYMKRLIALRKINARIVRQHFFAYRSTTKYDAIVNMGATEHLPNYTETMRRYAALLAPGGRVYIDALATRTKYRASSFMVRHIYPGNSTPLVLHQYLAAAAKSPLLVDRVIDDRWNYHLTCQAWARRLEASEDEISRRWGPDVYRKFHMWLVASAVGFADGVLQAYRLVLYLPE